MDREKEMTDCTAFSYCIEITNGRGDVIETATIVCEANSEIPTKEIFEYHRRKQTDCAEKEILTVYELCRYKPLQKIGEFVLNQHMAELPKTIQIIFDIDSNQKIGVRLQDRDNQEHYVELPLYKKRAEESFLMRTEEEPVVVYLQQNIEKLNGYGRQCFSLPQEKGLWKIAGQCKDFLYKIKNVPNYQNNKEVLEDFIKIIDNLGYAIQPETNRETDSFSVFVAEEYQCFLKIAEKYMGLTLIEAEGALFDPQIHYAVEHKNIPMLEKDVVIEEIQKGFLWNEKLFRAAMVKVAN